MDARDYMRNPEEESQSSSSSHAMSQSEFPGPPSHAEMGRRAHPGVSSKARAIAGVVAEFFD